VGWTIFTFHLLVLIFGGPDANASSTSEPRLLVSGVADLRGARTLVSGVEEIDMPSEDPIVHFSPPYLEVEPRDEVPC
jgi:hypothetical protein